VVNKAALTIHAANASRVAGQAPAALTATYQGLVNGDTAAVVHGLVLSSAGASSNVAGAYPITASGASASNYTITYVSGTLTVSPGAFSTFRLSPSTVAPTAGQSFALTVTALDEYDNVVTGYRGSVALTSSDPQATGLGSHTFTAADNGEVTFHVTLYRLGLVGLTLTDPLTHVTKTIDVDVR
jgi:hypothetical protein